MIQLVSTFDLQAFAAERTPKQDAGIDTLRPAILAWLEDFGNRSLREDVVNAAGELWSDSYREQDQEDLLFLAELQRFKESIGESLTETSAPDSPPSDAQVERIATWLSVSAINSGFAAGYSASGGVRVRWTTMHDNSVRETHRATDGQTRMLGDTFDVGGFDLKYPGDPVGPPSVWINCRCILAPAGRRGRNAVTAAALEEVEPDDLLPDDIELDDEDLVDDVMDEIPVHGVATIEGRPTGDGRGFRPGALSFGQLPQPLGFEFESSHGGDNSRVAIVGRIDEFWTVETESGYNEARWRGVIFAAKPYAPQALEGIIDGSYTGVSVIVDDVAFDVDEVIAENKVPVTWISEARIRRFDMVPTGAYQEGYISLGPDFVDELDEEQLAALEACGCMADDTEEFRDVSTEERKKLADEGKAMPDGSFPIANVEDLRNAIQAIGRAKDPEAARRFIKKRARELGEEALIPEGWSLLEQIADAPIVDATDTPVDNLDPFAAAAFAPGTKDGPGWITHPRATARIRRYWVRGKGAAKIRWGVPGDFNRCRRQLAKYVQNPEWLAGLCANMHKEAIGVWPGQEGPGRGRHSLAASAVEAAPLFTLVAAGSPASAPAEWFENPQLAGPTALHVDLDTGRIYGHLATWGVCHIGIPGTCTTAPHSSSNYAFFRTGVVRTEEGTEVPVGHITLATGHAPIRANAQAAAAHYDNTGSVVADVAAGEDSHGIWIAGSLRAGVDLERATILKAASLSGDWRAIAGSLELVGALAVNVPGFPIPRTALAASAERQESLVAAGVVAPEALLASAFGPEEIIAITRNAVAEYRYQEKREARLEALRPVREQVRAERIAAARAAAEEE